MHAGRIPNRPELCEPVGVTARTSDRGVWHPSSRGLFKSSIYPVEHFAGVSEVGSADLGAERIGPPIAGIVVVCRHSLHERVGDAPHALSREPEGTMRI
jgi:hypothetical protein